MSYARMVARYEAANERAKEVRMSLEIVPADEHDPEAYGIDTGFYIVDENNNSYGYCEDMEEAQEKLSRMQK